MKNPYCPYLLLETIFAKSKKKARSLSFSFASASSCLSKSDF